VGLHECTASSAHAVSKATTKRRGREVGILAIVLAVVAAGCGGKSNTAKPTGSTTLTPQQLIALVSKSTVEVFGREGKSGEAGGTGVVLDAQKGLVLTNAHVISGLATVRARFKDTEVPAQIVGQNPCEDIAVVRLLEKPPGMRSITFGTAANVKSGQSVTALGYPGSLQEPGHARLTATQGTVSVDGTISAKPDPALPNYTSVIQHQAPINPGNSGGPLVDRRGRLLGINSLLAPGKEEQNYAISIDHIRSFLPSLESGHNTAYVGWDLYPADQLTDQDTTDLGWHYKSGGVGMAVLGVDPGSPADKRHFGFGDYIEDLNGSEVDTVGDVCEIVQSNEHKVIDVKGFDLVNDGKSWHDRIRPQ
jgi:S1-C subfamily serine protease